MNRPWMPLYVADYLADTAHLRAAESGAYMHLIMHYWRNEALPNDDVQLAAIAKMTEEEWRRARSLIEPLFKAGKWKHKRVELELAKARQKETAGRSGGLAKAKRKPSEIGGDTPSTPVTVTLAVSKEEELTVRKEVDTREAPKPPIVLIPPEAMALADDLTVIAGHNPKAPPVSWCGAAMHVSKWLREGWTRDVILVGARLAMGKKRDGPPFSIKFFEYEIAREIARQNTPLPKATAAAQQIISGGSNGAYRGRGGAIRNRIEIARRATSDDGGAGDGTKVPPGFV